MDTQVVILAGGLGTRLEGRTKNRPKSMVTVCDKPFLEYQLELLKNGGINHVLLCIGYMGEQIAEHFGNGRKYGVNITYSTEERPLGTAGALKRAESFLKDTFFTMYGEAYLFLDFNEVMRYFRSHSKLALMTVYKNYDLYDKSNTVVEGDLVKKYSKEERTKDTVYIDYGINIFNKEVLKMVPGNNFYSLEELFNDLIEREELLAFEVMERFYEIGSLSGLKDFEQYINGVK